MGAKLSLLAPSAPTVAISSYIDILDNIEYVELINNSRFLKTIKAVDNNSGNLIIIKILIKPSSGIKNYNINLQSTIERLGKEASLLSQFNNVLPWHKIIETDRAGYLIRQAIRTNLYDRLSLRPFLEPIEKAFLAFQMLKIVEELHDKISIHHGDIKLENFMVTSWNWLMLSDFSSHIKPTYLPEDNPNQFSFFFDSSGRRVCYIAPERFYNDNDSKHAPKKRSNSNDTTNEVTVTNAMDLFSLGCAISELYLDGEPTFTLSQFFKFVKGEYSPGLTAINDVHIKSMVAQLLHRDPSKRPGVSDILSRYRNKCFPSYFYDFLYDFLSHLNDNDEISSTNGVNLVIEEERDNDYSLSDLKMEHIYTNFAKIVKALGINYDYDESDNTKADLSCLGLKLEGMKKTYHIKLSAELKLVESADQPSLIILSLVFSLLKTLKRPTSKIRACEIILALSERISDDCKLDRSLPYLCSFLDEYIETNGILSTNLNSNGVSISEREEWLVSAQVVCTSLRTITTLLGSCSYISPINVLMFPEYLLPKLSLLLGVKSTRDEQRAIKTTLAACLPQLASIAKKFWLMSKTFNSNAFKNYNSRYISKSLVNVTEDVADKSSSFSLSKEQLFSDFENIATALLTDSDPIVKATLVSNIISLCKFFGVDKTNSVILPHLITYLNDPEYSLRLSLLQSILQIGPFIGVLSFEQYLLPLLIQSLKDPEQFVVLKVLEIFHTFVRSWLINPKVEFNSLAIYKELLTNVVSFLIHPNEWIRQSVVSLILAISDNLLYADRYCFLYPLIKRYLVYDLSSIEWDSLYTCLSKPLSKQIFELLVLWCHEASDKSLFWQQKSILMVKDPKGKAASTKIVSFSKDLGKSVYLPNNGSDMNSSYPSMQDRYGLPLSSEDKQWILKLNSIGLDNKDLWKIADLRDYISHIRKFNHYHNHNGPDHVEEGQIIPRNVFFEICYKSEPLSASTQVMMANVESTASTSMVKELDFTLDGTGAHSLILPNINKVKVSLQTVQANVFGELETTHEPPLTTGAPLHLNNIHHRHVHSTKSFNSTHKVFSVNQERIITANLKHSYTGDNPYILRYLQSVDIQATLDDFSEFGTPVKSYTIRKILTWDIQGVCFSHVNSNYEANNLELTNCIAVSPSSEFFVTGSESGLLQLWDVTKLERRYPARHPALSVNLHSPIKCVKFVPDRFVLAVTTLDSCIRLFRVHFTRGKNKSISKYNRFELVRHYKFESLDYGYVNNVEFLINSQNTWLILSTTASKLVVFDFIKMEKEFEILNPLIHGVISSFIVHPKELWLLLGTNQGVLCLWDLRFKNLVKQWRVGVNKERDSCFKVKRLFLMPANFHLDAKHETTSYFAMLGGANESDISMWEIPNFECREIFIPQCDSPKVKTYTLFEFETHNMEDLGRIDSMLSLDTPSTFDVTEKGFTSMSYIATGSKGYFVTSTWDRRLILWDVTKIEDSITIGCSPLASTFTRSKVGQKFSINYEKLTKDLVKDKPSTSKTSTPDLAKIINKDSIHPDQITCVESLSYPFIMLVSTDRSGYIKLYK